jgi:hypothetical protein
LPKRREHSRKVGVTCRSGAALFCCRWLYTAALLAAKVPLS